VFGLHADFGVADLQAMVFAVWDWNDERKQSQD
jgi:hypothetical protein